RGEEERPLGGLVGAGLEDAELGGMLVAAAGQVEGDAAREAVEVTRARAGRGQAPDRLGGWAVASPVEDALGEARHVHSLSGRAAGGSRGAWNDSCVAG